MRLMPPCARTVREQVRFGKRRPAPPRSMVLRSIMPIPLQVTFGGSDRPSPASALSFNKPL